MPKPRTILIDRVPHYPVSVVAKLLGTTPNKVRELMGNGALEWNQPKVNGAILVSAESVKRHLEGRKTKNE